MGWIWRFSALTAILLSACAPRGELDVLPAAGRIGEVAPVFVATSRAPGQAGRFGPQRQSDLSFGRYDIAVPPAHETGQIEWPAGPPDPLTDFLTSGIAAFPDAARMRRALRDELRRAPAGKRIAVVYVHGFNNTFAEGLYRLAQLSHDFDLSGVSVHYSWPSAGNPLGYEYDRDSVLFARDGLERTIETVRAAGPDGILLIAHSMGALLTMETLRQMAIADPGGFDRKLRGVALLSPDIDVEVFRQQAARIGPLPQPFVIFASDRDRVLRLSARLTGQAGRLGTLTDPERLSGLEVTLLDISEFSRGPGHFDTATSPELIRMLKLLPGIDAAFTHDPAGRAGLIPGTVLTVQNVTQIILSPITAITQ